MTAAAARDAKEAVRLNMLVLEEPAGFEEIARTQLERSLNSSVDCAVSEALALARLLPQAGRLLQEQDLVRVSGWGNVTRGTPDGAVDAPLGLYAVQVVRHGDGVGCASLLRTFLEKVAKSLSWQ